MEPAHDRDYHSELARASCRMHICVASRMVELILQKSHYKCDSGTRDCDRVKNGFGHIGVTVPDVCEACGRFKKLLRGFTQGTLLIDGGMKGLEFMDILAKRLCTHGFQSSIQRILLQPEAGTRAGCHLQRQGVLEH